MAHDPMPPELVRQGLAVRASLDRLERDVTAFVARFDEWEDAVEKWLDSRTDLVSPERGRLLEILGVEEARWARLEVAGLIEDARSR